jgi:hypothetical protein
VEERQKELGLLSLKLDYTTVDWQRVSMDAAYRRPPFQAGDTEKGFRDALVIESFIQLVNDSPKTPQACRLVLVTGDKLVAEAVGLRIVDSSNVSVLPSLEDLKGLINTLVSEVGEEFISALRPKAQRLFFIPKDESTLYYKENIGKKLTEKFAAELRALPLGASNRKNGTWTINNPNFAKKVERRVHWISRVEIAMEASRTVSDESLQGLGRYGAGSYNPLAISAFDPPNLLCRVSQVSLPCRTW